MAPSTKEQLRTIQIEKAMAVGKAHAASQLLARRGYFDCESHKVVIEFKSGAEYRFPAKLCLRAWRMSQKLSLLTSRFLRQDWALIGQILT